MAQTAPLPRFDLVSAPLADGTVLLEASAGTGKTYTLTGIVLRLLLERTVERLEHVLVVTFTVAAAAELRNRLRDGLERALAACTGEHDKDPFFAGLATHGADGAQRLRQALTDFDQATIVTIHGFCKRVLDEAAFESRQPFRLEFAVDENPLWQHAAADALRRLRRRDQPIVGALLAASKVTPESLTALYRLWQSRPDAQLPDDGVAVAVRLDNLRAAVHRAAAAFDDDVKAQLPSLPWKKDKSPFYGDPEGHLEALHQQFGTQPEHALASLLDFGKTHLADALRKGSAGQLRHAFFAECEQVHVEYELATAAARSELLRQMHACLELHKQEQGVLTFQDLLVRTHGALTDAATGKALLERLRGRHHVGLIDEFQDTDPLQYTIFSQVFANRPLFLVGDPKQSIYGFRGADLATYLRARGDAVARGTLDRNFRSSAPLVAAVAELFRRPHTFVEPRIRLPQVRANAAADQLLLTGDGRAAMQIRVLPQAPGDGGWKVEQARARVTADLTAEIQDLLTGPCRLDGKPVKPGDVAVLSRTNAEAMQVQESLRAAGITSVIGKAGDVFATDELVELERLLHAILRPNDGRAARAAMSTRIWGLDAAAIASLGPDDPDMLAAIERLDAWRTIWLRHGFIVMQHQLFADLTTEDRLLRLVGGERRLANLQQLAEMLHGAEHEHRLSPESLLHWLQRETAHKDEIDYERREMRLESDDDAVQILTVHGSKGLQYPIVFAPFLWSGRRPMQKDALVARDADQGHEVVYGLANDDPRNRQLAAERLAEDMRLAYVALTRAQRRCYVYLQLPGQESDSQAQNPLAWLLHPEPPSMEPDDWATKWYAGAKARQGDYVPWLHQAAAACHGAIEVDEAVREPRLRPAAPAGAPTAALRRRAPAPLPSRRPLALHSFTSLVRGSEPGVMPHDIDDPAAVRDAAAGEGIFGFARGAAAGQCLHEVLERVDFAALDAPATASLVEHRLQQSGLDRNDAHPGAIDPAATVLTMLHELAGAHAAPGGPTYGEITAGSRAVEWQFTLPVGSPDVRALAALFRRHGGEVARTYADRLASLPPRTFAGYLTGFVDLVAAHDGRHWIVDWKSNHLGNSPSDYGSVDLARAMHEHDYVLQYHLYVLALHRHLRQRLADYDYERHVAGASYAFLRGVARGVAHGVFFDRPPVPLVAAMDQWAAAPASTPARRTR
jgi:exodeoxyribonuclease V beta subunit